MLLRFWQHILHLRNYIAKRLFIPQKTSEDDREHFSMEMYYENSKGCNQVFEPEKWSY